mmetsp:Transcript_1912/g.3980  ORF Transcript_1912/g.3980 Transcript_1912/m.3980 type:complete len:246 (+) Transcript_1912:493-1230(+)
MRMFQNHDISHRQGCGQELPEGGPSGGLVGDRNARFVPFLGECVSWWIVVVAVAFLHLGLSLLLLLLLLLLFLPFLELFFFKRSLTLPCPLHSQFSLINQGIVLDGLLQYRSIDGNTLIVLRLPSTLSLLCRGMDARQRPLVNQDNFARRSQRGKHGRAFAERNFGHVFAHAVCQTQGQAKPAEQIGVHDQGLVMRLGRFGAANAAAGTSIGGGGGGCGIGTLSTLWLLLLRSWPTANNTRGLPP